nr:hypothetical protein [uncultured Anaeromusa sp.]
MRIKIKEMAPLLCFFCFCALTQLFVGAPLLQQGEPPLVDTDCYMRLVRVEQLAASGDWFDSSFARSNAPYGEVSHWTRPLDVLLLGGALVGSFWLPFREALFWWAVVFSPLLQLASLVVLFWAAQPLLTRDGRFRLGLLFWGQSGIWGYFALARPDHHSLLLFLFLIFLGLAVRMTLRPGRSGAACGAGAVVALAMWVSVETLAVVAAVWMTLGLLCLNRPQRTWIYSRQGAAFSLALLGAAALALFIERGWEAFLVVEFDKLSLAQLAIFAWGSALWLFLWLYPGKGRWRNLVVTAVFALAGFLAAWLGCPDLLQGPFANIDKRIIPLWLERVQEVQSLWPPSQENLAKFFLLLGHALLAIPYFICLWLRKSLKNVHFLWLVGSVIFTVLTCYQVRWAPYAEAVLIFPATMLLLQLLKLVETCSLPLVCRALARVALTVFFCLGPWMIGSVLYEAAPAVSVKVTPMADWLNEEAARGVDSKIILADIDFGPELLYRTPHRIIASPYHRNGAGILFAHEVMASVKEEEALALLRQRGVDWLLLCPASTEGAYFNPRQNPEALYARLLRGEGPSWLQPLLLPPQLAGTFYLYQVCYEAADTAGASK